MHSAPDNHVFRGVVPFIVPITPRIILDILSPLGELFDTPLTRTDSGNDILICEVQQLRLRQFRNASHIKIPLPRIVLAT